MMPAGQFRISKVQVLDWGAYRGLKVMHVHRRGTAILGPSGRGKSTILDAMASVIMSNPQSFNQAARDDRAGKSERTVYTYARGLTDTRKDANRRSNVTSYLRPPGSPGFASGAGITWEHDDGRKVTVFRLAWIGPDVTAQDAVNDATMYGIVFAEFDFARLSGLTGNRAGSSPLSRGNLLGLVDESRGDLVDGSQSRIHAAMRSAMSMGRTDEAQKNAQILLRRAQASKGLFNINDVFKKFVLSEPAAIDRWVSALDAYREAARLYDVFERARRRARTLEDLPDYADQHHHAQAQYSAKRRMLRDEGDASPLRVWHTIRIRDWADARVEELKPQRAEARAACEAAEQARTAADATVAAIIAEMTANGGDPTGSFQVRIDAEQGHLARVDAERERLAGSLAAFGYQVPDDEAQFDVLRATIVTDVKDRRAAYAHLAQAANSAVVDAGDLDRQRRLLVRERDDVAHASNIPPFAHTLRERIIDGTGVPADRLAYVGELIEIRPAKREWEAAVLSVLGGIAQELIVDRRDFTRVRSFVDTMSMRGTIRLVPVDAAPATLAEPIPGTVPELLELAPESPYTAWLCQELVDRFSYVYVESDTDLDLPRPRGANGAVTRGGMRTASRDRFVKSTPTDRYRWLGWDTARLRADLDDEIDVLTGRLNAANELARDAQADRDTAAGAITRLEQLAGGMRWEDLDRRTRVQTIEALAAELAAADSPENADRKQRLTRAQDAHSDAVAAHARAVTSRDGLEQAFGDLVDLQDSTADLLDAHAVSASDLKALGTLGFMPPGYTAGASSPGTLKSAVAASYRQAVDDLGRQVEGHLGKAIDMEKTILATMRAYRNVDDQTVREIDESIDSLPALLEIREQLVRDDLPRAKDEWLEQARQDMNGKLRALLVQIDEDRRIIRRGLDPINEVLEHVVFREVSRLTIEAVEKPSKELNELRQLIEQHTSNTLGLLATEDAAQIERGFVELRDTLGRLDEMTQTSEAWRQRVFDAREHVDFRAVEMRPDGEQIIHDGVSGMSGGEGQELIAFVLGAALRYRLGDGGAAAPVYASIVLDEGFVKADSDYTGRALAALSALGFQLIVGAPREKATAFEDHVANVAYITSDVANRDGVHIYEMTIQEALAIEEPDDLEDDAA